MLNVDKVEGGYRITYGTILKKKKKVVATWPLVEQFLKERYEESKRKQNE